MTERVQSKTISIRNLREEEVEIPIAWARSEGWNPGLHDGPSEYPVDPKGWFAAECNGEVVGTGVCTNYDDSYAFVGYYIVRPDFREGYAGLALMQAMKRHAGNRTIGIDGVFELQQKYADVLGFTFAYRNIRWVGIAAGHPQSGLVAPEEVDAAALLAYDTAHVPAQRPVFLEQWLTQPNAITRVKVVSDGSIQGYGVIRRCFEGHKIGPLFAETPEIANSLYEGLTSGVPGEKVFFDTPEPNADAVLMAQERGMKEVFGTARMYSGKAPALPLDTIYGVTTFELG